MIRQQIDSARRFVVGPSTVEERNIRFLVAQTVFTGVINGGVITFMPVYLARIGASPFTISLLTSAPALVTILLSLPSGGIVARQRRLVPWTAKGYLAVRFTYGLAAIAAFLDPAIAALVMVLLWAVQAVPATLANTGWYGVLAEAMSPRRRPVVNGVRWGLLGLVSAISVSVFGTLLDTLPFPLGYQIVFLTSFLMGAISVAFYVRVQIPDQVPVQSGGRSSPRQQIDQLVGPLAEGGPFLHYVLAGAVLRLGLFMAIGLYSIYWVDALKATDTLIGLRTTVGNVAQTVGYYFWGRAAGRLGHIKGLALAAAGLGFYPLLTAFIPGAEWLVPIALVWGLFASGIDISLFEGILEVAPADRRPQFVAVNTFVANAVALISPIIGAGLAALIGIPGVLIVASGLHFAAVVVVFILSRNRRMRGNPGSEVTTT